MASGDVVPTGADQIEPKGLDELLADLGGGGHGSVGSRADLGEQLGAVLYENWQIDLYGAPDHTVSHVLIFVREEVAEVNDPAAFWNGSKHLGRSLSDYLQSFANGDEFTLNRGAD